MRFKRYMTEEYYAGGFFDRIAKKDYVEVFKNPSQTEIRKINPSMVKFIADNKTKTLYVFRANVTAHAYIWDEIKNPNDNREIYKHSDFLVGTMNNFGGKYQFVLNDEPMSLKKFEWLNKYGIL